ncbi:hypothetical protein BC826DRAFT_1100810 [Russula brevipes]|nr:hypothetical protein BC826DRAFT_1100810 [Russula brevipes]
MLSTTRLLCVVFLASVSHGWLGSPEKDTPSDVQYICNRIKKAISGPSEVFFPPAPQYFSDISHASSSSSQVSTCSVEPGSVEDVSKILNILGSSRTPFAVKGGGHSTNPKFSSTSGVQISMSRFNHTKVNVAEETVEIGAGLTWDQVYVALNSTGVNVVGGRVPGVGVAGLTLGGGYSFKTSQYGLTVDNVVGYELVLPNGTFINVTPKDSDLWFALRGGLNNFGIVTKFILKSHPQGDIWGGLLFYAENQLDAIKKALNNFQQKKDTKAALLVALAYSSNQLTVVVFVFYDAPTHGGVFDEFLAIPTTQGTVHTRSFSDFVFSESTVVPDGLRTFYCDAPVTQYSPAVFDAFVNQTKFWGTRLSALDGNVTVSSTLEPLDNDYLSHGSGSAYPPDRSHAIFHSIMSTVWANASLDEEMAHALRQAYVNYALFDTPLEDIYGGNVERLREIRAVIDPKDVMGLAGALNSKITWFCL